MTASPRLTAVTWASTIVARPDVVYLDTETTGLDDAAEIVDIAVVDNAGRVLLDTLVKPSRPIPPDATRIHHITDPMVASAPTWPEVYLALLALIRRYPCVVIYNADFDTQMIRQSSRPHRLPAPEADWHCAMRRYAEYAGVWSATRSSYRWHKLEVAAGRLGVPPANAHRALEDARTCRAVVHAMARPATTHPTS